MEIQKLIEFELDGCSEFIKKIDLKQSELIIRKFRDFVREGWEQSNGVWVGDYPVEPVESLPVARRS